MNLRLLNSHKTCDSDRDLEQNINHDTLSSNSSSSCFPPPTSGDDPYKISQLIARIMIIIRGKKHLKAKFYENLGIGCSEENQKTVRKKTMEPHPYLKEKSTNTVRVNF